jgi:hypothetical protein
VSSPNVELVERNYQVVNSIGRTDSGFVDPEDVAPDLWSRLAEDFELHERADLPDAKVYRGSDVRLELAETDVFWFREGMLVRLQAFATKAEALEAARGTTPGG